MIKNIFQKIFLIPFYSYLYLLYKLKIMEKYQNKTPIDILFERANMKCTKCGCRAGTCDCWTKCNIEGCKWSYEKGTKCNNPEHDKKGNHLN